MSNIEFRMTSAFIIRRSVFDISITLKPTYVQPFIFNKAVAFFNMHLNKAAVIVLEQCLLIYFVVQIR
jgi:hypothetical protein